jgi:hypothetical protein
MSSLSYIDIPHLLHRGSDILLGSIDSQFRDNDLKDIITASIAELGNILHQRHWTAIKILYMIYHY